MQAGLSVGLLGALALTAAGLFDAEPLYVPGVALLVLAVGLPLWVYAASRGLRIERELGAREVLEGQPLTARIKVSSGRARIPGGLIEDPLLAAPIRLRAARRSGFRVETTFGRRGDRELEPTRITVGDPLRLAERTVAGTTGDRILVLPAIFEVRSFAAGGKGDGLFHRSGRGSSSAAEIDGLRPHREGSPASRIHWATLARGAPLMERRMIEGVDERPLVVLDVRNPDSERALDTAVRATASLIVKIGRAGSCDVLLPGDRRPTSVGPDLLGWPALHARLARLGAGGPPPATLAPGRRSTVLVRARTGETPASWRGGQRGLTVVVPGLLPGRSASFEVAGCRGYPLDVAPSARVA